MCLPRAGLWLDPRDVRELAFVSHAHSDHTGFHRRILCTPATARLMQVRLGEDRRIRNSGLRRAQKILMTGRRACSRRVMCWVRRNCFTRIEGTLLYTGDFKLRKGLSSEPPRFRQAETLVMETTYGMPRYQFPPTEETLGAVINFAWRRSKRAKRRCCLAIPLARRRKFSRRSRGLSSRSCCTQRSRKSRRSTRSLK